MHREKRQIRIRTDDLIGVRVGRLEVKEYVGNKYDMTLGGPKLRHYYKCQCDCGVIKVIQRGPLLSRIIHSCGCSKRRRSNGN